METSTYDVFPSQKLLQHLFDGFRSMSIIDTVALAITLIIVTAYLSRGIFWDKPDPFYHIYFERPQQQDGFNNSQAPAERNIARKLVASNKKAVVFWGSQSGTAERFANQLAKECHLRFGFDALSADLSDYDPNSIAELSESHFSIFILSTYGEGDPSDNASSLWDWVHNASNASLSHLRFAAFGLGNSNYKYYNRVVDVVVTALVKLGAHLSLPVGKADDAHRSTEEDFLAWKEDLFTVFRKDLRLEERIVEFQPTIAIIEDESLTPIDLHHGEPAHSRDNPKAAAACSPIQALPVKSPRELFSTSKRNCVHLELDLSESPEIHYKTGDHLAVWPSNPLVEVQTLLDALGIRERQDIPVSLRSIDPSVKIQLPTPTTTRALFTHYLEICAPVSRSIIQGLVSFAPSDEAKSLVVQLGQDKTFYSKYLEHTHITFGRLLHLASPTRPWSRLPLSYVLEALSPLQPRYYSISSSSVLSPRRAAITALVAADPLPANIDQKINGITSNYLLALSRSPGESSLPVTTQGNMTNAEYNLDGPSNMLHGTRLFAHVRKSKFKLPIQSSCPIVMVAAGTGLAPFRAFIAERAKLHAVGRPIGDMILFFGCRKPEEDFIYREELEHIQATLPEGKLRIVTAFSREDSQSGKVYVQQRVREYGSDLVSLLEEKGASFFICGRASMAREVGFALGEVVKSTNAWTDAQVKDWSEALKRRGKWREDVWG